MIKELVDKVANELEELLESYNVRNLVVEILEDYFVVREKDTVYSDYFFCKLRRNDYEVVEIKMKKKESLQRINECATIIQNKLALYSEEFNKLFGISIKTLDELKENMKYLLDSAIDKNYKIGKEVKREWSESKDFYGVVLNPSGFFDIVFTDEDKRYYNKSNMRFYCEFDRDTIDVDAMADFLCKIIDRNMDCLEKYYKEGLENG